MRLNVQVRLYPNQIMKTVLDSLCDYRRYCWNQGLDVQPADMSKWVTIKSHSVEIKNMVPNIMSMFVTTAVMKMTVTTMQCSTY